MTSPLLEGVELKSRVCEIAGLEVHSAKTQHETDITAITIQGEASTAARAAFDRIVRFGAFGGLQVERADTNVVLASPWATGTVAHLPSLGWRLQERLGVFQEVAQLVKNYHDQGCAAGPFDPNYVMLDSDFRPFLLGPSIAPVDTPYTAPETVQSARVDKFSDIYSLGRLLHFVLTQDAPPISTEDPARLDDLVTYPAGLSRIIRKATRRNPKQRYGTIDEMLDEIGRYGRYEDVGLAHPDIEEQNLGGVSFRPPAQSVPKAPEPVQSPQELIANFGEIQPFKLKQSTRAGLLIGGVVAVCGAFAVNYFAGDGNWIRGLLALAAGLVGFAAFNPGIDKESTVRTVFATFFASAMFFWNPTHIIAQLAEEAGLSSGSAEKRADAFKSLSQRGHIKYTGVNLAGADLREQRFFFTKMDGASLEGADLTGSEFFNVDFSGTEFRGANLSDAVFESTVVDTALNFDQAVCNGSSRLPQGWVCENARPQRDRGAEGDVEEEPSAG